MTVEMQSAVKARAASGHGSASAMKRPAAAPAATLLKPGEKPTFDPAGRPVHYLKGVIYTDMKKQVFRIYKTRGDRIDQQVAFKTCGKEAAWARALEHIEVEHPDME